LEHEIKYAQSLSFCDSDLPDFIPTPNNRQIKDAEKPCNNFA